MLCNHHYHYRVVLEHLITPKGNWYLLSSHSQSPFLPPLPPLTTTNLPSVSMELSILDISHIIYYFLIFSKFLFYKNGLLLQLQTKQAPVTLTPAQPPHPIPRPVALHTPPTSLRSGAGPSTSHTGCRLPVRGCRCPWPRGAAWRSTVSADPAREGQTRGYRRGKCSEPGPSWRKSQHIAGLNPPLRSEVGPDVLAGAT